MCLSFQLQLANYSQRIVNVIFQKKIVSPSVLLYFCAVLIEAFKKDIFTINQALFQLANNMPLFHLTNRESSINTTKYTQGKIG
jgi:hypothetical protein